MPVLAGMFTDEKLWEVVVPPDAHDVLKLGSVPPPVGTLA
jgi:hypothetical protein